jgi:hypothetical protein
MTIPLRLGPSGPRSDTPAGSQGPQGPQGTAGSPGSNGPQGTAGAQGVAGFSTTFAGDALDFATSRSVSDTLATNQVQLSIPIFIEDPVVVTPNQGRKVWLWTTDLSIELQTGDRTECVLTFTAEEPVSEITQSRTRSKPFVAGTPRRATFEAFATFFLLFPGTWTFNCYAEQIGGTNGRIAIRTGGALYQITAEVAL